MPVIHNQHPGTLDGTFRSDVQTLGRANGALSIASGSASKLPAASGYSSSLMTRIQEKDGRQPFLRHYGVRWVREDAQLRRGFMLGRPASPPRNQICNFWPAGGIYVLLCDTRPIYVGIGGKIGSRLVKHASEPRLCTEWDHFSWFSTEELDQLEVVDSVVLKQARPPVGGGDKGGRETRPVRVWWTWSDIEVLFYLAVPTVRPFQSRPDFGTIPVPVRWMQAPSQEVIGLKTYFPPKGKFHR